ncbi:MAG: UDP-N-acetylglucosamine 1-carboxyvinyltransferase [Bdellovibrio sp.]
MDKFFVKGPVKLNGEVRVSRAKNAFLPILAAALLNDKKLVLNNVPKLRDINTMKKLLEAMGVKVEVNGSDWHIDSSNITSYEAPYDLVKTMRASICVLGPLLTRFGEAKVSLPGGCAIGTRPIDIHLSNLEKMGAEIKIEGGYVHAKAKKLKGVHLPLNFPSVGATENLMMAAVFAEGTTVIENAALEPEVSDLAHFLNKMGAKISGIDTQKLVIEGVKSLNPINYEVIGDRIEAGTFICAALMTGGDLKVSGFNPKHLEFVIDKLIAAGAKIDVGTDFVHVHPSQLKPLKLETHPYPGFPTDLQAQFMALMMTIDGFSLITENIFENRFMHVPELNRLGANIELKGNTAIVTGKSKLIGAPIMCTDLRASAALVMGALCAEGTTEVQRVYHIDRGYEDIDKKLQALGVSIERFNDGN